jgi:PilZ domain
MRVLKAAKIVMDDWRSMDCIVRDISETGARIKVGSSAHLPHRFKLLITAENTIRDVQVAWFLPEQIGVVFTSEARKAPVRKF